MSASVNWRCDFREQILLFERIPLVNELKMNESLERIKVSITRLNAQLSPLGFLI